MGKLTSQTVKGRGEAAFKLYRPALAVQCLFMAQPVFYLWGLSRQFLYYFTHTHRKRVQTLLVPSRITNCISLFVFTVCKVIQNRRFLKSLWCWPSTFTLFIFSFPHHSTVWSYLKWLLNNGPLKHPNGYMKWQK